MVLERDYTLQQGDTKRIIIPVFDSDSSDRTFFGDIDGVSVEFFIAETFESDSAIFVASDTNIQLELFSDVKIDSEAFDFSEVDTPEGFSIPQDQSVITVTLPQSETELITSGEKVYQCRVVDTATPPNRLTPVKGTITVEPSTPTSE